MKSFIFSTFMIVMMGSNTATAQAKPASTAPISQDWNKPSNYYEPPAAVIDKNRKPEVGKVPDEENNGSPLKQKAAPAAASPMPADKQGKELKKARIN